jgi:hypothetical protein
MSKCPLKSPVLKAASYCRYWLWAWIIKPGLPCFDLISFQVDWMVREPVKTWNHFS